MQFALTTNPTKTVQADKDAPRYAQCVWCGMPVELHAWTIDNPYFLWDDIDRACYSYLHTSDLSATECQKLREAGQAELDEVLGVKR